jgi:hypothetical protein
MRLRVVALVTILITCLALIPYEVSITRYDWRYDPANYAKIAVWAGCTADIFVDQTDDPTGSFYSMGHHVLVIGGKETPGVPYYAGLIILLHETGHCLQDQEGKLPGYAWDPKPYELDADRRAADLACGLGLDGRGLLKDTFVWAHDFFGYNGDWAHGTLQERMSQGDLAQACNKVVGD